MRVNWPLRILLGVVLLGLLLAGGIALRVWQVARTDDREHADVIIVLGSTQNNGEPKPILQARLDHAKILYDAGVAHTIVTVGGKQPADRFTEAQAGVQYLQKAGVPEADLVAVNSGNDTLHSLQAAAAELETKGWRTAVLVSDPWHSLRSQLMARDSGIDATVSPTHSGPIVQQRSTEIRYIARETIALLYYRLTRTSPDKVAASR